MYQHQANEVGPARPRLIQLYVPEDLYEDVIGFIAERRKERMMQTTDTHDSLDTDETAVWRDDELVALLEGANPQLVRALVAIARSNMASANGNPCMTAEQVADAAGVEAGRAWGGFISRAQTSSRKQWGKPLPIWGEYDRDAGMNVYEIDESDGSVITRWAGDRPLNQIRA